MSYSIKDVADRAGVSAATVSYVINGAKKVKLETRTRVEQAMSELHYSPNPIARRLRLGRNKIVGFITPYITIPFYSNVLESCAAALMEEGYRILIGGSNLNLNTERDLINTLSNGIVDGIILFSLCGNSKELQDELPEDCPCVVVDVHYPAMVDCITHTFSDAFFEMVGYFKQRGHQKIGLFIGPAILNSVQEQIRAYRDALNAHNLSFDESMCVYFTRISDIYSSVEQIMAKGCMALCFINSGIYRSAFYNSEKAEFVIPNGCDIVCASESPEDYYLLKPFPRIIVPTREIGYLAAKQMLFRIEENYDSNKNAEKKKPEIKKIIIPCKLQYSQHEFLNTK
ncbi:MAG: LacI family transcriptional regulator [Clostridiales bacterium]|jgi:LacI family transcriptional regulator|nr:LacI family transcriptional regulator [Clostridiales bacterium]